MRGTCDCVSNKAITRFTVNRWEPSTFAGIIGDMTGVRPIGKANFEIDVQYA